MALWFKKKPGKEGADGTGQDVKMRNVAACLGFVSMALAFMWLWSMKDAHDMAEASLREAYAIQIESAKRPAVEIGMFNREDLPWLKDGEMDVDLDLAVTEVAAAQNQFVSVTDAGFTDFDRYAEQVQSIWSSMEEWFPNSSSHSWYGWDMGRASASWTGFRTTDIQGRPMGVWLCMTDDGQLLAYATAWYAGEHQFSNWYSGVTKSGLELLPHDEYEDPLSGTYETSPGDGDTGDGRDLEDHIDSALTILDGLGMTHNWYDDAVRNNQEESDQEEAGQEGGGQDGGQAETE